MLWAAPVLALLAIPAVAALGIDPSHDPQQLAYLYGMALLGTWTALIPNKAVETRPIDRRGRRLIALAAGLAVGGAGLAMALLRLDSGLTVQHEFFSNPVTIAPLYFGLLYAISAGWSSLTARDRKARFRIMPVLWTALLSGALIPLWPYVRQDGIAIAAMIAATVQVVSPWNEAAARYAEYVRASKKQKRRA
jgi:FtsH-binding integral membrane protein